MSKLAHSNDETMEQIERLNDDAFNPPEPEDSAQILPLKSGKCIVFENPTILDLNALRIMGVSVKHGDSPIGMFGTGLKYAMATVLRLGGEVEIVIDQKHHLITSREVVIRDQSFNQVVLDNEPMGFTTDLGKKWEAWMAVRELLSNARDEGGQTFEHDYNDYLPMPDGTSIILRGDTFMDVWANRHEYFLKDSTPLETHSECDFFSHTCSSRPSVFYKGIRIYQAESPMMYTYNLKGSVELTEDRTLKYNHQLRDRVCAAIVESDNEEMIQSVLVASDYSGEGNLDFDIHHTPSEAFKKVCHRLIRQKPKDLNQKAVAYYRKKTGDKPDLTIIKPTAVQQKMIDRAVKFLSAMGYADELESMPMQVVEWLGEGTMGQAKLGRIYLAKPIFDFGSKYIASTILEEIVSIRCNTIFHKIS